MSKKNVITNTNKQQTSETRKVFDTYDDIFTFKRKPISKEGLMLLIQEGIKWAQKEERHYKIMPFFRARGVGSTDIKRWRQKYSEFDDKYKEMKAILGDRREYGALEKRLDAGIVARSMHRYDSEWADIDKHHADLRKIEQQIQGPITVVMDKIPTCDSVPVKKKESS